MIELFGREKMPCFRDCSANLYQICVSWVCSHLQFSYGQPFDVFHLAGGKWRDLFLVASVTSLNTFLAGSLPFLGGKPQPLLISNIFDKTLILARQIQSHLFLSMTGKEDGRQLLT